MAVKVEQFEKLIERIEVLKLLEIVNKETKSFNINKAVSYEDILAKRNLTNAGIDSLIGEAEIE